MLLDVSDDMTDSLGPTDVVLIVLEWDVSFGLSVCLSVSLSEATSHGTSQEELLGAEGIAHET